MDETKDPPSGYTGQRYPELFDIRAMPPQPTVKKPGQLSEEKVKEFFTKGYVVVENFFNQSELDPIKEAINKYVDDLANKLYKAGKISNCSYIDLDSYKTLVPTAWIPFLDADETNGCLQFIEGGHLPGLVAKHTCCWGGTWYTMLETEEMEKALGLSMEKQLRTLPIKYGSFVLFNNLIPHRSLDNVSDHVRWSVDLRWHKTSDPAGFYGIKDGVQMRSSTYPNQKPDWDDFDGVNRHEAQAKYAPKQEPSTDDEFETSIVGPWMTKWDIVHVNKHVAAFQSDKPATSMG